MAVSGHFLRHIHMYDERPRETDPGQVGLKTWPRSCGKGPSGLSRRDILTSATGVWGGRNEDLPTLAPRPPPRSPSFGTKFVFEVAEMKTPGQFELYFPGRKPVGDVPFIGVWQDGALIRTAWGAAARDVLAGYYPSLKKVRFYDS